MTTRHALTVAAPRGAATQQTEPAEAVTHIIAVLDRSGSMSGHARTVRKGFNSYIDQLRACPDGDVRVSYVRFDGEIEMVFDGVPLGDVPRMTPELYRPRGSTALLDAIGMTLSAVTETPGDSYHLFVHTDGLENASQEWTADAVRKLIEDYQAKDNWTLSFFGQGPDAWQQAEGFGYRADASARYEPAMMRDLYAAKARATNVMRSRKIASSTRFAAAAASVMNEPTMTDDEIERALEDDSDARV